MVDQLILVGECQVSSTNRSQDNEHEQVCDSDDQSVVVNYEFLDPMHCANAIHNHDRLCLGAREQTLDKVNQTAKAYLI